MQHAMVMNVLSDPLAQELLHSPLLTRLAYNGLDGSPRVVPIGYVWNGTSFIMSTAVAAPKVRALEANPKVAMKNRSPTYCRSIGPPPLHEGQGVEAPSFVRATRNLHGERRPAPSSHQIWR